MKFLVKKAQRGDAEAFIALIEENKQNMYKVARGFLSNDEDIADAISETILDCYEKIHTLKQSSYFRTWMVRILINNCKDILRKCRRDIAVDMVLETEDQGPGRERELQGFQELVAPLPKRTQEELIRAGIPKEKLLKMGEELKSYDGVEGYTVLNFEFLDSIAGFEEEGFFEFSRFDGWMAIFRFRNSENTGFDSCTIVLESKSFG